MGEKGKEVELVISDFFLVVCYLHWRSAVVVVGWWASGVGKGLPLYLSYCFWHFGSLDFTS